MAISAEDARQLIEETQPLVRSLAQKISRKIPMQIEFEDLIAYGQIGLAEAARDFDPQRGIQFSTYAYYRIRGAIYDGVSKMSWTSRARYNRLRYEQMANETLAELNESTSESGSGTLEEETRWFRLAAERLAMVCLVTNPQEEQGPSADALIDPAEPANTVVANRELAERLHSLVDGLDPAEKRLIRIVYFEGATLQEASHRLGISKSWGSRLHARALEQLALRLRRLGVSELG
ncbi:MAG: sigma-70 family RNA polymerase sigma factor [Pirellulaceae bacterium]|nr:sigma-70 family RNA polymerase sigma factor [Pirellulaceae bacterium]